jgi:hypothetical protein
MHGLAISLSLCCYMSVQLDVMRSSLSFWSLLLIWLFALFVSQDPGTEQAIRSWPSIDVGTEMFNADNSDTAEWTVSDFDVLIP